MAGVPEQTDVPEMATPHHPADQKVMPASDKGGSGHRRHRGKEQPENQDRTAH